LDVPQPDVLSILCCPVDHAKLTPASATLLNEINDAIRRREIRNRGGRTLDQTLDGGLVKVTGDVVYPIVVGIPVLVKDEAIETNQLAGHRNGA
jgi:uncharacterized protein YbaR (Trm112 family)